MDSKSLALNLTAFVISVTFLAVTFASASWMPIAIGIGFGTGMSFWKNFGPASK